MLNSEGPARNRPHTRLCEEPTTTVPQAADIDRARRRLRLHHLLVRRPRWSAELDELCAIASPDAIDDLGEPYHGDYWADCHMHLGVHEREALGRAA